MKWLEVADGVIAVDRILAVGRVDSAPLKRLLAATPPSQVLLLTGGRRKTTILFLDSGHVVITAVALEDLKRRLGTDRRQEMNPVVEGGNNHGQLELFLG
ncbi:MAG: DUF370 domain-containing protein [Chloroflexi bacterium]|nr:DUF370 domain-containing protein [Chloroflexota bacterium]MBK8935225.1 DUF370 domain-containing protein [Chloroflexota bacterium]MBP7045955.1 DUF370 domain-containing protein [Chloroflexota bacterium]